MCATHICTVCRSGPPAQRSLTGIGPGSVSIAASSTLERESAARVAAKEVVPLDSEFDAKVVVVPHWLENAVIYLGAEDASFETGGAMYVSIGMNRNEVKSSE